MVRKYMIVMKRIIELISKTFQSTVHHMPKLQQPMNSCILTQIVMLRNEVTKLIITKALLLTILGVSTKVNTEIQLNRYSFFESLQNELLSNTRLEFNFEIESDDNLIWQAADDCRVTITRMQLFVPRITINSEDESLYMSGFLNPQKWTYLRENAERRNSSQQMAGNFKISSGISKARHVFVFIINDAIFYLKV